MQGYGHTLITAEGSKMLTAVDGAKGKITYTKAALYTQDIKGMSEDKQRALTSLDDEQMSTPVVVTDINDNTVTVSASFNNAKVTKDITFNSIGWFAKTTVDDQERLLAVTPSDTEQTLVAGSNGASTSALDINMAFARSDNATVDIKPTEAGLISQAQLDAAINQVKINLEAEFPDVVKDAVNQIDNNIKSLTALNSDSGNNIYNTKINLDTFSTVGISKFLGCQLQSDGKMTGFDATQGNLYGWIFDVPKWNGAQTYEQIVYISDYGQGSLTYVRTKTDSTSKEDFFKVASDKDLGKIHTIANPTLEDNKTNPDSLSEPGIYYSKNGFNFDKSKIPDGYRIDGKTYVAVLEGDNPDNSINYYQQFMFQATKFNFECWYRAGYQYGTNAYYTVSFTNLKNIYSPLKQISVNGGTAVGPDDKGIANITVPDPDLSGYETKADAKSAHDSLQTTINKLPISSMQSDISTALNRISALENKETYHYSNSISDAKTYSANNPDVLVSSN